MDEKMGNHGGGSLFYFSNFNYKTQYIGYFMIGLECLIHMKEGREIVESAVSYKGMVKREINGILKLFFAIS